jgi:hypothetical protein
MKPPPAAFIVQYAFDLPKRAAVSVSKCIDTQIAFLWSFLVFFRILSQTLCRRRAQPEGDNARRQD